MGSILRVEMLGTFEAKARGGVISKFRTRRVAMLLAYLALHTKRVHTRDEIAELLWPDAEEATSRRNLRQALHSLRKVLEPPALPSGSILKVEQSLISLNLDAIITDIAEMETLIESAKDSNHPNEKLSQLKQAIALYKGDLLPGFDELWVMNERFRMEDLYLSTLKLTVSECINYSETDDAIQYLRLAIAKEPLDENLHKILIEQYLIASRPRRALEQYQELAQLLQSELSCQPSHEVELLAKQARKELGRNSIATTTKPTSNPAAEKTNSPPKSVVQSTIPIPVTRFFGRQKELASIQKLILTGETKLLTILGPAGTGKTRLSIEIAQSVTKQNWQVWFVPLADINTESQILDYILDTVKPRRDQSNQIEQICNVLNHDQTLLILDNFEHILESGVQVLQKLIEHLPKAAILVTSRQSLNIQSEVQFTINPLPIPSQPINGIVETREQLAALAEFPSIQMLVDRCQAIRPDVQITLQNAKYFVSICERLEGIPLALEIAAGLSKSSTPSQIVKQLDNRLLALTSRRRDVAPRHQSLRAAVEYSFHTLSPNLRSLFASLSVFKGGFSVESAFQVCVDHSIQSPSDHTHRHDLDTCLNKLLELQERSLIQTEQNERDEAPLRFRMLETFREFGEEQLSEAQFDQLQQNHANYYVNTELKENQAKDPEARTRLHALIKLDYNDYIAAINYLYRTRKIEPLIRLLVTLTTAWDVRGTKEIEQKLIRKVVDLPETETAPPADRIRLYRILATTYLRNSEFKAAYSSCRQALEVAQQINNEGMIAECYFGMSLCAGYLGEIDNCIDLCQQVLKYAPPTNSVLLERTYVSIGSAHWTRDEFDQAEAAFLKAQTVSQKFREGEPDALILAHIAGLYIDQNRLDQAMVVANDGMRISRKRDDDISLSACLAQIARYHRYKANLPAAMATGREALIKVRNVGISMLSLEVIRTYALILGNASNYADSAILIAASTGIESMERAADRRDANTTLELIKSKLNATQFEDAWARGLAMSRDDAFEYAIHSTA
jgi:predicted ATPase/DNA-binding SARP family transcriptional activator